MLQTMIDRIVNQPFMFAMFVGAMILLYIGAYTRIRHEAALGKRAHLERRKGPRVVPDTKFYEKRQKRG